MKGMLASYESVTGAAFLQAVALGPIHVALQCGHLQIYIVLLVSGMS